MHISLLQPTIIRGNIDHNARVIQSLVNRSQGDLLILPEYALTGSLVLDRSADIQAWAHRSAQVKNALRIPEGRYLLINSLIEQEGKVFNACELLPARETYYKLYPDQTELDAGILPGNLPKVFDICGKRFQALICYDLAHIAQIPIAEIDYLVFIYHFSSENHLRVLEEVKQVSLSRRLPVLVSSLVSDKNNGYSCYVNGETVVSLSGQEGILEVEGI